jgi:hypothetical protein
MSENEPATVTIELTPNQLDAVLAEMNMSRVELENDGFGASERANRRLAEDIITQAVGQGFRPDERPIVYGGEEVHVPETDGGVKPNYGTLGGM